MAEETTKFPINALTHKFCLLAKARSSLQKDAYSLLFIYKKNVQELKDLISRHFLLNIQHLKEYRDFHKAEELLENRGLKYNAWDAYEKSATSLPKTGMKQFEPNNTWLQNVQIEKGIETRKNLIAIERVDRISQLASAEWLPDQKRAKVKKHSGQSWSGFGLEKNGALYLIPEEALFLLEANSLELTWNDVPLSIQQAYELLIDNVECSLEEYRVYSQLVRHGYRIQRYIYNVEKNTKSEEGASIKRKVIVEPENGLWMTDNQQKNKDCTDTRNEKRSSSQNKTDTDSDSSLIEICPSTGNEKDVTNSIHDVMNDLLCAVEDIETQSKDVEMSDNSKRNGEKSDTDLQIVEKNEDKKKRGVKVEIISEETLLGNIKIITGNTNDNNKGNNMPTNWRASRIQRNVKLVPRRADKVSPIADTSDSNTKQPEQCAEKHKLSSPPRDDAEIKKSKHEVIELSDDEIQEVPKPMTRMELLNLIPNIAFLSTVTVKISRGYIPHSIKPHKTVYRYDSLKLKSLQLRDKKLRGELNPGHASSSGHQSTHQCNNTSAGDNYGRRNTNVVPYNQNSGRNVHNNLSQDYYSMQHRQYANYNSNYAYNNRSPYTYIQNLYWQQRNTTFQNVFVSMDNHSAAVHQNRYTSVQMHNLSMPNSMYSRNQFYHNFHHNMMPFRKVYHQSVVEDTSMQCSSTSRNALLPDPRQRYFPRNHHRNVNAASNSNDEFGKPTFKIVPGASSWSELKNKWREIKTITIDDEDTKKDAIEEEVQVVGQSRSPLIGPKNVNNLEEVFSKLRIIKSAPEKNVRRKKSKYKISYNVYSNAQSYKKANPGLPHYRIVVIRQDDPFIQPIELHRLMQDADNSPILLACVSMSISYIQPGLISVPNLT